jgi:hypothetical protein
MLAESGFTVGAAAELGAQVDGVIAGIFSERFQLATRTTLLHHLLPFPVSPFSTPHPLEEGCYSSVLSMIRADCYSQASLSRPQPRSTVPRALLS